MVGAVVISDHAGEDNFAATLHDGALGDHVACLAGCEIVYTQVYGGEFVAFAAQRGDGCCAAYSIHRGGYHAAMNAAATGISDQFGSVWDEEGDEVLAGLQELESYHLVKGDHILDEAFKQVILLLLGHVCYFFGGGKLMLLDGKSCVAGNASLADHGSKDAKKCKAHVIMWSIVIRGSIASPCPLQQLERVTANTGRASSQRREEMISRKNAKTQKIQQ